MKIKDLKIYECESGKKIVLLSTTVYTYLGTVTLLATSKSPKSMTAAMTLFAIGTAANKCYHNLYKNNKMKVLK